MVTPHEQSARMGTIEMMFHLFKEIFQLGGALCFLVPVTGHPDAAVSRFDAGHGGVCPAFFRHLPLLCRLVSIGNDDKGTIM